MPPFHTLPSSLRRPPLTAPSLPMTLARSFYPSPATSSLIFSNPPPSATPTFWKPLPTVNPPPVSYSFMGIQARRRKKPLYKGFGFVTFKHVDGAVVALKEPSKKLDDRMTVNQLASAVLLGRKGGNSGHGGGTGSSADVWARKIFVGNVPFDFSSERLLSHSTRLVKLKGTPGFEEETVKSKGFAI